MTMSVFKKEYDIGAKRAWRCHVCNDIHYGAAPPLVCPTCGAKRAFILIDRDETLKVLGERGGSLASTQSIIDAWKKFGDMGEEYKLVEDAEMVSGLAEGVLNNQKGHGLRYCPCRLATGDFNADLKLICPCNFQVQQTWTERGECWCGLFVRRNKQ
jgi:ferredoxin-thioredoxin reductase catalytic chain